MKKDIDIICAGEILIDFIGMQDDVSIKETTSYSRYLGGSPTNVAVNTSRLGLNPHIVCAVGNDGLGDFMLSKLGAYHLDTQSVGVRESQPTSVILVSKTTGTPDFIAYREADKEIYEEQFSQELLERSKVFHTTCFALSKKPAQTSIMAAAKRAKELGLKLSIDVNFSESIWPEREEAVEVIKTYCSYNPLVKISEDDMFRLFEAHKSHEEIFDFFHSNGVDLVCLTLGAAGVKIARRDAEILKFPALKIDFIADATGAGDAFWSGFLFGYLSGFNDKEAAQTALKMAGLKLQYLGTIPEDVDVLAKIS